MLVKRTDDISASEITPESVYFDRRRFLEVAAAGTGAFLASSTFPVLLNAGNSLGVGRASEDDTGDDELTPYELITSYNNFYEFGTGKEDPARNARNFVTRPWTVRVEGEVSRPADYDLDDLLHPHTPEERIYRLRCVEAWSAVIPWLGIPLRDIISRLEPTSQARFVEFTTLYDPQQMPGQRRAVLRWPYVEGLRMDEAMHPLTIMAVGLYGRELPNQNGAPLRLVVPWKYGFKSVKSIVRMRFTRSMPVTTWADAAPREYGFFANVNPNVDHPRWSQARERPLGKWRRVRTRMFNGYADQVAHMYEGMDLRRWF